MITLSSWHERELFEAKGLQAINTLAKLVMYEVDEMNPAGRINGAPPFVKRGLCPRKTSIRRDLPNNGEKEILSEIQFSSTYPSGSAARFVAPGEENIEFVKKGEVKEDLYCCPNKAPFFPPTIQYLFG